MIISISNLLVNNQTYSGAAIRISDQYPTISWSGSFVDRITPTQSGSGEISAVSTATQAGYEIRIGTSIANLGLNSYSGSVIQTGFVSSTNTAYRYKGTLLAVGTNYYGQIRITDSLSNVSNWTVFSFRYNSVPSVVNVTITPPQPSPSDILLLSYVFTDPDGDIEQGSKIWWFKNGSHQRKFDGLLSISSENLTYGDTWSARVYPSDGLAFGSPGSSQTVKVATTTPVLDSLEILPISPTISDPLFAQYDFTGQLPDNSSIKWYVNNTVVPGFTKDFARIPVNAGDVVHFEVKASDGVSTGATYASNSVVIAPAPFIVSNLRINNNDEPLSVNTLTPSISWVIGNNGRTPTTVNVSVGTAAGANNILNVTVPYTVPVYTIPSGTLQSGADYYVTISVGDSQNTSEPESIHFRTRGSRWQSQVSNSTGWTIESTFRINSGYQGFRIYDGVRHAEIRFYQDQMILVSGQVTTVAGDFSNFSTITITGQGININVYQNYTLILNGTGLFLVTTPDKMIEFGSINSVGTSSADYLNLYYSVSGAFTPGSSPAYADIVYSTFYENTGTIDYITSANSQMYFSTSSNDVNASSNIYKVSDYVQPIEVTTVNKTFSPINSISVGGKYTYFSHSRGATVFSNYVIPQYDSCLNFKTPQKPENNGWDLVDELGAITYSGSGMEINSLAGGEAFFSQNQIGSLWFDNVNNNGWTVSFSLGVSALNSSRDSENTDIPDGFGVYVNDGSFWETIYFYKDEIFFANSGVSIPFNTTSVTDYTVLGIGQSLQVFARIGNAPYTQIGTSIFNTAATNEGNAGRPSICEDYLGNQHAVWHDDGGEFSQIYYSTTTNGVWGNPIPVVSIPFGAKHPDIACDFDGSSLNVYVVFEDEQNDYTNIGLVVRNRYGWSQPYQINSGIYDSLYPRVAIDESHNVHIVWQDLSDIQCAIMYVWRKFANGNWCEPVTLSMGTNPAIAASGSDVYISFTESNKIVVQRISNNGSPTTAYPCSHTSQADFSDVAVQGGNVYVVWHDIYGTSNGEFEIFGAVLTRSLGYTTGQSQITSNTSSSRFPCLGARAGSDAYAGNVYLVWEFNESQIKAAYYDQSVGNWLSDNQTHVSGMTSYGGIDVLFAFNDLRVTRRPRIAKTFSNNANVVYETEMATDIDEYLSSTYEFTTVRDAVWNLDYASSITPFGSTDAVVSGQMPRKEIRFGDFSENISGDFVFGYFKYYTGDAVAPFNIALVSTRTQPILDNRSFCANVNVNGDAWIGTEKGLSFYFRQQNAIANSSDFTATVRAIAFDQNGIMYVGTDDGSLYASVDHRTFSTLTITGVTVTSPITDLIVAPDNTLWMATFGDGVLQLVTEPAVVPLTSGQPPLAVACNLFDLSDGLPSLNVFRVRADVADVIWACTDSGLVAISPPTLLQVYTASNSGLPSSRITDVAIVDSNTRYVATSAGLALMTGTLVEQIEINDPNWNGNVKSLAFLAPNILWAGTMSYMFQIMIGPNGTYSWTSYAPSTYTLSSTAYDDLQTYYIVGLDTTSLSPDPLIEVYVNGRLVLYGYAISITGDVMAVQFVSPLLRSDVVTVRVRADITQYATLERNQAETIAYGPLSSKVQKFITDGDVLYVATSPGPQPRGLSQGNSPMASLLRLDYSDNYNMPYGKIGLDTTPPYGQLNLQSQIDRDDVLLNITGYGDNLSGLYEMKVSNYDNFTSDGATPLPWVPFSPLFSFNLGTDLGLSSTQLVFPSGQQGARIAQFTNAAGNTTLLAGCSFPAQIYAYDPSTYGWKLVTTLDLDISGNPNPLTSIQFMTTFNASFIVGTGNSSGVGKIYISSDGVNFNLLSSVEGDHAYCATVLNNILYVGTGPNGIIYSYTGQAIKQAYAGMSANIYSLAAYGPNIYAATGEQGRIFQWNPVTNVAIIINVDNDTDLTATIGCFVQPPASATTTTTGTTGTKTTVPTSDPSIVSVTAPQATTTNNSTDPTGNQSTNSGQTTTPTGDDVIFYGTGNTSRIMKSDEQSPFYTSYVTITGNEVAFLKVFQDTGSGGILYAGVGQTLLYYGNKVWLAKQGVTDTIQDAYIDNNGNIWIVTNGSIFHTSTNITQKTIYLKLRDRAGNETQGAQTALQLSIKISDLQNFINNDRILELDEYGNTVFTYDGSSPFFSASRVETENGTYISTVFDGTDEQVSWGTIYWDAVVPDGCTLKIGVRSSSTKDLIGSVAWTYYDQTQYAGVDISSYTGQYIQFCAVMSSTIRGLSPSLYKIVITSVIKASVHFFTTNFILPSPIVSGIITSQKILPVSADIVFGIDTNNSVNFSDYQIIPENMIFTAGMSQAGKNLRVGVQLISPTLPPLNTDFYPEYDPYGSPLFVNVVDFNYTATTTGTKNFEVAFYDSSDLSNQVALLSTAVDATGWSINGLPFTTGGYAMNNGDTASVICSIEGTSALRCNQYYWVVIKEANTTISTGDSFIAGCNTSFVDSISFDFTNGEGSTKTFNFRVKIYSDPARTQWVQTFFSGSSTVGWTVGVSNITEPGVVVANGQMVDISFLPDVSSLTIGQTYYLVIDSYDGTSFKPISKAWTFKTTPLSTGSCGEYTNVPVLKNFAIMFELQDGSYIMLNT